MGLRIETWNIAYRKKAENTFRNTGAPFTLISNGYKGWYADPFLFDYNGDTYLFAEYFSYKLGRGVISVAKYYPAKDSFCEFSEIIREDYHLSYPVVFEYDSQIYMMPECGESNGLYFYEAVDFPSKWKKISVADEKIRLADTTPFMLGKDLYALSLKQKMDSASGELILMKYDGSFFKTVKIITDDMSVARPGGNIIIGEDGSLVRVSQNCKDDYGKALNFIKVQDLSGEYREEIICRWQPDSVSLTNGKNAEGVHTYNSSRLLEVVDLKFYRNSWYRLFLKLFHKG